MKKTIDSLCLGTAQFGLDYGIANRQGRPSKEETFRILDYAHTKGIDSIDTAYSYMESECLIGDFMAKYDKSFKIISKTPSLDKLSPLDVKHYFLRTLKNLGQKSIYGYLIHKFDDLVLYKNTLFDNIRSLREKGLVKKIGVSLYYEKELEYVLDNYRDVDIVQLPYSILDQRFKRYLPFLKERGIEVYARSVFLQGLFFIEMDRLEKYFCSAKNCLKKLQEVSNRQNIPISSLCLAFVLLNPFIDKVIIGVDSITQLKEDISSLMYIDRVGDIYNLLESLRLEDEKVILPINWKL